MENTKPVTISQEDIAALAKLEKLIGKPPQELHKYQSCQRLGGVFLLNCDYANCTRVCNVLEAWTSAREGSDAIPEQQICKVELWLHLTKIQCMLTLDAEANEQNVLKSAQALLKLFGNCAAGVVDATTFNASVSKFRALMWQGKQTTALEQMFAVELFCRAELCSAEDNAMVFSKYLPMLVHKLRAKRVYSAGKEARILAACKRFGITPPFDFAVWVFENSKQTALLGKLANTEREYLFAAHSCDKLGLVREASDICIKGMLAGVVERNANPPLVSFHVKNLCLQPGKDQVLLIAQQAQCEKLKYYATVEYALFAQFRKLGEYVSRHTIASPLPPVLHAKALYALHDSKQAWEVLQQQTHHGEWFLECLLRTELGLDCTDAAKRLKEQRGNEQEIHTWLVLHGHNYNTEYFSAECSATAMAVQQSKNDAHAAMQLLLGLVDELRTREHAPEQEFQTLRRVLDTLQLLAELYQHQGLSSQARYFYSKALLLAKARKLLGGEVQRITDKLEILSLLEGKPQQQQRQPSDFADAVGEAERHFAHMFLAETNQQIYPKSVPRFLRTCRYECAKILFFQQEYKACFDMLDSEASGLPPADTLKARAFLKQTESDITSKKLNELVQSCVLASDLVTLVQLYQHVLENASKMSIEEEAFLVCASVGIAARFESEAKFAWHKQDTIKLAAKLQRKQVKSKLDDTWTVCTLYFEQDTLYMCRTERERDFIVRVDGCGSILRELLNDFQSIMLRNADQLENCTVEFAKTRSQRAKDKWWNDRFELDSELDEWVQRFERECLGWRTVLLRGKRECSTQLLRVLEREFDDDDKQRDLARVCLNSGLSAGTVAKALVECFPEKTGEWAQKLALECSSSTPAAHSPVLLCLSGSLQQIPFESLPCLQQQSVSRIASLPFALVPPPSANAQQKLNMSYVIDPEDTLKRTQVALRERLEDMRDLGMCNAGIIGKSNEDVAKAFQRYLEESSLVLYCGHGCGEQFVDPRKVTAANGAQWAPVILMGCSSASRKPMGIFEPNGKVVDAYLQRCPLVIGTLWNVSDVDIDRYTLAMLDGIKEGEGDLLHLVAVSRQVCKLRKLVGAATVCFGVPWCVQ